LPETANNFFEVTALKLQTHDISVKKIDATESSARIIFAEKANIDTMQLILMIQTQSSLYKFNGKDTMHIIKDMEQPEDRILMIQKTLSQLTQQEAA